MDIDGSVQPLEHVPACQMGGLCATGKEGTAQQTSGR